MYGVDATIIGAGVVGLSIACRISPSLRHVVVLESEPGPGRGISSRNSEVIHAGIYYPEGSVKAQLCVKGSSMIYAFCSKYDIPFRKIGKVVVAASEKEDASIEELFLKGTDNGAPGLRMLGPKELAEIEPRVKGTCALHSPNTGILDSHRFIKRLESMCIDRGVTFLYNSSVLGLEKTASGFVCTVEDTRRASYCFSSQVVINAAGLGSDQIASLAGIDIDQAHYRIFPVKGEYFRVRPSKQHMIKGLVYPSPEKHLTGLGIHATKDLSGSLRLGPNAIYVEHMDYDVDPKHARDFFESTHAIMPFLEKDDLIPDMAGIRPKLQEKGAAFCDFVISHENSRSMEGLINLIGIESPGLTSCLAIAEKVAFILNEDGLFQVAL
ncbi:MAG TPA: NAD(P)/FAD-dependent oxidoreductase [Deltaproteobacteria bacterium]|mgnify:CR=1 FL=1|nr:NAD(P)/FAD-dependent oxidoreductase [Deltaproteobacteria bacterium]